jgi:hypothetical protein
MPDSFDGFRIVTVRFSSFQTYQCDEVNLRTHQPTAGDLVASRVESRVYCVCFVCACGNRESKHLHPGSRSDRRTRYEARSRTIESPTSIARQRLDHRNPYGRGHSGRSLRLFQHPVDRVALGIRIRSSILPALDSRHNILPCLRPFDLPWDLPPNVSDLGRARQSSMIQTETTTRKKRRPNRTVNRLNRKPRRAESRGNIHPGTYQSHVTASS